MKHRELIDAVIFLALLAVSHSFNVEKLSPGVQRSMKSFKNEAFTLDEAHKKCADYLTTTLAEFLQKVPKTPNNVSENQPPNKFHRFSPLMKIIEILSDWYRMEPQN
jgi:hypothetical protein